MHDPDTNISENSIIPEKFLLNNTSIHKIEGFDDIRSKAKIEKKKQQFLSETKKLLSLFDIDSKKYDHKLVLAICQSAEDFFNKRGMGDIKLQCVVESVKIFFNNDEVLVKKIVDMIFPNIKQTSKYRRIKIWVLVFFSSLVQIMSAN